MYVCTDVEADSNMMGRPSITDGVHRKENCMDIIPVFSTFSNFFKKKKE